LANIVASVIASVSPQADGRRWIREIHTDLVGLQFERTYLAGALDDLNAALSAYAIILGNNLRDAEIAYNVLTIISVGSLASPTLVYSTAAQNFAALRAAYKDATQVQAVMIGDFLNTLTDAQLQNAFNLTAAQVTSLRTNKLQPAATLAAQVRATAGQ